MTGDILVALVIFAVVSSITPGPNNMMLLASGVNFGIRRTVPHALGVSIGFAAMLVAVGFGLNAAFEAVPGLYLVLRFLGAGYLLWLAWRIAHAGPPSAGGASKGRPMSFLEASAFQWVNPKAWVMAVGALSNYTPRDGYMVNVAIVAAVFAIVNLPCVSIWAGAGAAMRSVLEKPAVLRAFNWTMAAALVATLYPIFAGSFG